MSRVTHLLGYRDAFVEQQDSYRGIIIKYILLDSGALVFLGAFAAFCRANPVRCTWPIWILCVLFGIFLLSSVYGIIHCFAGISRLDKAIKRITEDIDRSLSQEDRV